MIKRRTPCSQIANFIALFAIVAVNLLGLGHFHPPSGADSGAAQSLAFSAVSPVDFDGGNDGNVDHDPDGDIGHGCDFCWLHGVAKTGAPVRSPAFILPDFSEQAVWYLPRSTHRSFLDTFSFLVRGPPTFLPR